MADLSEYGRRGDLDAPFALTKKHERARRDAERIEAAAQEIARDAPPLSPERSRPSRGYSGLPSSRASS